MEDTLNIAQSHTLPLVEHTQFDVSVANAWDYSKDWQHDDVHAMGKDFGYLLMYKANGVFFEGLLDAMREDGYELKRVRDRG